MNTGIGDAVNLAWKLAAVLGDAATPALLDSYEPERIAFARRLVATTDRLFQLSPRAGPPAAAVRTRLVPRLLRALLPRKATRRFMFRTVSQIEIDYRDGALASGRAGRIEAGDRMPFVLLPAGAGVPDNLQLLPGPAGTFRFTAVETRLAGRRLCWRVTRCACTHGRRRPRPPASYATPVI